MINKMPPKNKLAIIKQKIQSKPIPGKELKPIEKAKAIEKVLEPKISKVEQRKFDTRYKPQQPYQKQATQLDKNETFLRQLNKEVNDKSYAEEDGNITIIGTDLAKIIKKYADKRIGNYYLTEFFNKLNTLGASYQYKFLRDELGKDGKALDLLDSYRLSVIDEKKSLITEEAIKYKMDEILDKEKEKIILEKRKEDEELFGSDIEGEEDYIGEDDINTELSKRLDEETLRNMAIKELEESIEDRVLRKEIKTKEVIVPVYYIKKEDYYILKGDENKIKDIVSKYSNELGIDFDDYSEYGVYRINPENLPELKEILKNIRENKLTSKMLKKTMDVYIKQEIIEDKDKIIILGGKDLPEFYDKYGDDIDIEIREKDGEEDEYIVNSKDRKNLDNILSTLYTEEDIKRGIFRHRIEYTKGYKSTCVKNYRNTPWFGRRADAIYVNPIEGDFSDYIIASVSIFINLNDTVSSRDMNLPVNIYLANTKFFDAQCNRYRDERFMDGNILNFFSDDKDIYKKEYKCNVIFAFGDEFIIQDEDLFQKEILYNKKDIGTFYDNFSNLVKRNLNSFSKEDLIYLKEILNITLNNQIKKVKKDHQEINFGFIDDFIDINYDNTLLLSVSKFSNIVSYFTPKIFNLTLTFKERVLNGYYTEEVSNDLLLTLNNNTVFPEVYLNNEEIENYVSKVSEKIASNILRQFYGILYHTSIDLEPIEMDIQPPNINLIDIYSEIKEKCINKIRDDIKPGDLFIYREGKNEEGIFEKEEKNEEGKFYCFDLRNSDEDLSSGINPYSGNKLSESVIEEITLLKGKKKEARAHLTPGLLEKVLDNIVSMEDSLGIKAEAIILEFDKYGIKIDSNKELDIEDVIENIDISPEDLEEIDGDDEEEKIDNIATELIFEKEYLDDLCVYCNEFLNEDSLKSIITINGESKLVKFCSTYCIEQKDFKERKNKKEGISSLNTLLKKINDTDLKEFMKRIFKLIKKEWKNDIIYSNKDILDIIEVESKDTSINIKSPEIMEKIKNIIKSLLAEKIVYYYATPISYKLIVSDKGKRAYSEYMAEFKKHRDNSEFEMDDNYRFIIRDKGDKDREEDSSEEESEGVKTEKENEEGNKSISNKGISDDKLKYIEKVISSEKKTSNILSAQEKVLDEFSESYVPKKLKKAFKDYVLHIHPLDRFAFLEKVINKGEERSEYLKELLSEEEFKDLEEDILQENSSEEEDRESKHADLYDFPTNNKSKAIIYKAFIEKLKQIDSKDRADVYIYFTDMKDVSVRQKKNPEKTREKIYNKFFAKLAIMDTDDAHKLINSLFDSDFNIHNYTLEKLEMIPGDKSKGYIEKGNKSKKGVNIKPKSVNFEEVIVKSSQLKRPGIKRSKNIPISNNKEMTETPLTTLRLLKNIENSCYIDSVLFPLLSIPNKYISSTLLNPEQDLSPPSCVKNNKEKNKNIKLEIKKEIISLYKLVNDIGDNPENILYCKNLKALMNKCDKINIDTEEGDPIEFLSKLLELFNMNNTYSEDQIYGTNDLNNLGDISYIKQNLGKFTKGDKITTKLGLVLVSNFTISNSYYDSIRSFDEIISDDKIDGGFKLKDKTNSEVSVFKRKISVMEYTSPKFLVLALQRVGLNDRGEMEKINKKISITPTFKNMELYAIVSHIGNANGGHYITYFKYSIEEKSSPSGELWYKYDDIEPTIKRVGNFEKLKANRGEVEKNGVLFFFR